MYDQEYREYEDYEFAGFWVRVRAFCIDAFFTAIFVYSVVFFGGFFNLDEDNLYLGVVIFYSFIFEVWLVTKIGGSPGKYFLNLKIVRSRSGQSLSFFHALCRYVFSLLLFNFLIGHVWVAIDDKKRAWHDLLFNTVVIRYTKKEPVRFAPPVPPTPKPPKPEKRRRHHCL